MLSNFLDEFSKEINGIIHVGAHTGQEVNEYSKYKNKIILFEPQKDIFDKLIENVSKHQNVNCYNIGLGAKNEKKIILDVDHIVICAGQLSNSSLHKQLISNEVKAHLIGGAFKAAEIDAKEAINQAVKLAAII